MEDELDYGKVQALQAAQSPEAQEQALAALGKVGDKYLLPHEGLDASKTLAEFDARAKRADTEIRKIYGPNTRGYNRYKARHANEQIARRKAIANAVTAEMKHGAQVAMKTDTENRIARLIETDTIDAAGVLANQAADGEVASEALNNGVEQTTSENEFATDKLKADRDARKAEAKTEDEKNAIDADYAQKKALLDTATAGTRAALGDIGIRELTQISMQEEVHARKRAEPLRKEFRNIFMQRYKAHRAMNQSHEIAYANALEAARQGAISYFSERIKTGQVGSVLYTLDELERIGDEDYKKSVTDKTPTGVYDPSAYGFCRKSDMLALRKSAVEQISYYRHVQSLKIAGRDEGLKIANAKIRFEADRLARQPILDMDAMEQLFSKTDKLINAGLTQGAETSTYLRGIVERAERKLSRTQKEASKLQTEEDFEREYNMFMRDINGAAPMYFFSQTADGKDLLQFTMDENGKPVHIDGQNRMILLIRNGLSRGVVKGNVWKERLEQLENDRAMEDRYAAMSALADAGIAFDPKGTQKVIDARGGSYAAMNDERGGVYDSSWGEDKTTHRLRVGNHQIMMYTYRDPVTGRTVPINGTQLNDLLKEVELWQMRHPNPSPTGGKPVELTEFIKRSLDRSIVRETKKRWFSNDEYDIPVSFVGISSAAHKEYEAYFAPKGNVPVYGKDIWGLQGKVLGGELPTTETIRKFLTDPKVWTTKGK